MDLRKIKKLIELLEESGIAEIEVKEGEESIKLSRASQVQQPIINTQTYDVPPVLSLFNCLLGGPRRQNPYSGGGCLNL